ncbi:MAG TPA: MFS transporter [Dehalococcoidia bacterium]|nr:MFS transporter [Dehalococcoidia bacterium]
MRLLIGTSVLWFGLSMFADGVTTLILPDLLEDQLPEGLEGTVLGLVTFVGLAAAALVQPVAGHLSDRLGAGWRRQPVIAAGVAVSLPGAALLALGPGLPWVLAGYFVLLLALSVAQAGQQALVPDLVREERRGRAAGLKGVMDLGGALVAFLVLGVTLEQGGPVPGLAIMSAVLVGVFLLGLVLQPRWPSAPPPRESRPRPADAFRLDLRTHAAFVRVTVARLLFLFGVYAVGRFFLFLADDRLGMEADEAEEEAAFLLAGLTLVSLLAALLGGWFADRRGRATAMTLGAYLGAGGIALLVVARSQASLFGFGALLALGSGLFTAGNWAQAADLAPQEERARFMALANLGTAGAIAAAGLLGPVIDAGNAASDGLGYDLLLAVAAASVFASALAVRPLAPSRERPAPAIRRPSGGVT